MSREKIIIIIAVIGWSICLGGLIWIYQEPINQALSALTSWDKAKDEPIEIIPYEKKVDFVATSSEEGFVTLEYDLVSDDAYALFSGETSYDNKTVTLIFSQTEKNIQSWEYIVTSDLDGKWVARINKNAFTTGEYDVKVRVLIPSESKYKREYITAEEKITFVDDDPVSTPVEVSWNGKLTRVEPTESMGELVQEFIKYKYFGGTVLAGSVKTGEFADYSLFYIPVYQDGMYVSFSGHNYFLVDPAWQKVVILSLEPGWEHYIGRDAGDILDYSDQLIIRTDLDINPPVASKQLTLKNTNIEIEKRAETTKYDFSSTTLYSVIDESVDGRPLYFENGKGWFYSVLEDGTAHSYVYKLDFLAEEQVPNITWNDGSVNNSAYIKHDIYGGCGRASNYIALRDSITPDDLKTSAYSLAGNTPEGEQFYIITDAFDQRLIDLHEKFGWRGFGENREIIPYNEFISTRPLIYWVTPHDMVVELKRADYRPLAECGKPVVYLYPEEEQEVSVFVDLKGPMTVSEPEHGPDGWTVVSHTDGYVTNLADGEKYPNLFWEGFGVEYKTPEEGFVVAQEDIASWLPETLDNIGFTEREKAEFLEFWLPYIPNSPYVFFTFIDQSYFDRDAALIIEPKPDSVSRVFMEFYPLLSNKEVAALPLPQITREGFSVVEWGGLLYR